MTIRRILISASLVLLFAGLGLAQSKTVLAGVYSPAQAGRGEAAFHTNCSKCHEGNEPDGPLLTGPAFMDDWREDRLSSLFAHIRTDMPGDRPGSLDTATYLDILAFLLQVNGLPAGESDLTQEATRNTEMVGPNGPQPLPNNASVAVVGCLAAGAGNTWTLIKASDPIRVRNVDEVTPDELLAAARQPAGTLTFRLQNAPDSADAAKGHMILAKGVLLRQTNNDRINVTALGSVASTCSP